MQDYSELMLDAAPIGTEFCRRNGKMKQPINIHVGATLFATVTWTPQGWMGVRRAPFMLDRRTGKMKQPINIHVGATLFATVTWTPQGWMVQWTAGRKEGVDGLCEAMTLVGQTL